MAAKESFERLVEQHVRAGKSRAEGVRTVVVAYPALHSRYLAEINAGRVCAKQLERRAATIDSSEDSRPARAVDLWNARVDTLMEKFRLSRSDATERAVKEHPELHRAFLAAFNSDRPSAIRHLTN